MLQDIAPHYLENQYQNRKPVTSGSRILHFSGKQVFISRAKDDRLELPTWEEVRELCVMKDRGEETLQYLFAVDGSTYFLLMEEEQLPETEQYRYENVRTLRQVISKEVCFTVMTAYHLYVWYRSNRFCGHCGQSVVHDEKERMLRCPDCGNMIFPKIAPAVIVAVTDGSRILMSKYAGRDYKRYALLAGFTEIGETAEETVAREVMEEVGLKVKNIRYYKSQPWGVDSNLLLGFFAELDGDPTIRLDEEELSEAEWFERDAMPAHDDGISLTREMMGVFERGCQVKPDTDDRIPEASLLP